MLAVGCAVILDAHRGRTAGATELLCSGCSVPRLPEPSQVNPVTERSRPGSTAAGTWLVDRTKQTDILAS